MYGADAIVLFLVQLKIILSTGAAFQEGIGDILMNGEASFALDLCESLEVGVYVLRGFACKGGTEGGKEGGRNFGEDEGFCQSI